MWIPLLSSGELATTVCIYLCLRAAQTASNCCWGSAGEWGWRVTGEKKTVQFCSVYWMSCFHFYRNCKPRNRPSFRQILLHLDIASADILSTPQETYFQTQASLFDYCFFYDYYYTMSLLPQTRRHHKEIREKEIKLIGWFDPNMSLLVSRSLFYVTSECWFSVKGRPLFKPPS